MPRFRVSRNGPSVRIEFDDGGMNLLGSEALRELRVLLWDRHSCLSIDISGRSRVSVLQFSSARPALFAAGADMAEMRRFSGQEAEAFSRLGQELIAEIERLPMITVAMIDGDCFGGALDLALAFDLRFATPRARFAHPGSRIGIVTGFGGTSRWRKVLSRAAANQLFLANRVLSAGEALEIGLVDHVADGHDEELARLEALDPDTTRMVKELTNRGQRLSRSELLLMAERLEGVYGKRNPGAD